MHKFQVTDPRVGRNLRLLSRLIQHQVAKQKNIFKKVKSKLLPIYINRRTGLFGVQDGFSHDKSEWKAVRLKISFREADLLPFELEDPFIISDFHERAVCVIADTLNTINQEVQQPEEAATLDIEFPGPLSGEDLLNAAWYDVDRYEAEDLLLNQPIGTYLFREDDYTKIFEEELRIEKQRTIHCVTLSLVEPKQKITEMTLIHDGNRWFIYNDDPNLDEDSYASLDALLGSLTPLLSLPLTRVA